VYTKEEEKDKEEEKICARVHARTVLQFTSNRCSRLERLTANSSNATCSVEHQQATQSYNMLPHGSYISRPTSAMNVDSAIESNKLRWTAVRPDAKAPIPIRFDYDS
jgi:hypothetical protein